MENENNEQQGLQIDLRPEVAKGVYANLALITHSSSDFVLDFATMLPGMPKPEVGARLVMAPEHAKRLLQALQENVHNYEQQFGKIVIPEQQPRMAAPFKMPETES
jgi:hypothetical protein